MCGIFGVIGSNDAASLTVAGLHTLQHRAHDYGGLLTFDEDGAFYRKRGEGLITKIMDAESLQRLQGHQALGHIRYPTVADNDHDDPNVNVQPLRGSWGRGQIAMAHNGSLTQLDRLQGDIPPSRLSTSLDTEYILRLVQRFENDANDLVPALKAAFALLTGSYALGLLTADALYAVRDPSGNRPLSIGRLASGGYCISSETCAFPNVDATFVQDVAPGTIVIITKDEITEVRFAKERPKFCRFEAPYLSHPCSTVFGDPVDGFRKRLGEVLATEAPVPDADIITGVPDSANDIAHGFAESNQSGRLQRVISRNHYVGRTFIEPTQALRDTGVARKFLFTEHAIRDARIVVVDDSIVRGTTMNKLISKLKGLGAREVHVRVGFPPIRHPCRYGVDTKEPEELILNRLTVAELCGKLGADSLAFLSLEALRSLSSRPDDFCYACVTGEYWD